MHGNGMEPGHDEDFSAGPVPQMAIKSLAGAGAVEASLAQSLIDQPAFEVVNQRLSGTATKPFRLHIAERDLATYRRHGDADRLCLQQGDVQVQPLVGQPRLHVLDGFVVGPGGDGSRVVAMVERAADTNGADRKSVV